MNKQSTITLSSIKTKYIALKNTITKVLYILQVFKHIISSINFTTNNKPTILTDSINTKELSKNNCFYT